MRPVNQEQLSRRVTNLAEWYWQPKYNGWHVLCLPDGRMFTRHGLDISNWVGVQAIRQKLQSMRLTCSVVGELLNGKNNDDIQALQTGGQGKLVIFDIVKAGTFADRSFALQAMPVTRGVVEIAELGLPFRSWDSVRKALAYQQSIGNEGLVLKHKSGLYELGNKKSVESKHQVKVKVACLPAD